MRSGRLVLPSLVLVVLAGCGDPDMSAIVKSGRGPMLDHHRAILAEGPPADDADVACPALLAPDGSKRRVRLAHSSLLAQLDQSPASDRGTEPPFDIHWALGYRFSEFRLNNLRRYPDPFESDFATSEWGTAILQHLARPLLLVAWTTSTGGGGLTGEVEHGKRIFSPGWASVRLSLHDPHTGKRLCSFAVRGESSASMVSNYNDDASLQSRVYGDLAKQTLAAVPEALARVAPSLEINPSAVNSL